MHAIITTDIFGIIKKESSIFQIILTDIILL